MDPRQGNIQHDTSSPPFHTRHVADLIVTHKEPGTTARRDTAKRGSGGAIGGGFRLGHCPCVSYAAQRAATLAPTQKLSVARPTLVVGAQQPVGRP